jgi:hypothetical protein
MALFDNVLEEIRKTFEEHKKAREEKEIHELLSYYAKDRRGSITQINEPVLPPINSTKEVHTTRYHIHLPLSPPRMSLLCFPSMLNSIGTW